jgi:hypothetical protein
MPGLLQDTQNLCYFLLFGIPQTLDFIERLFCLVCLLTSRLVRGPGLEWGHDDMGGMTVWEWDTLTLLVE